MAAKKGRKTREKRRKQKAQAAQTRSQQKKRELGKLEKTAKQTARMQRIAEKAKKAQARKTSKARTRARKSAGVHGGRKQQNGQKRECTATSAGRSHGKDHVKQRNQRDKGKAKNHDTVSARGHAPTEPALSVVGANAKVLSHIDKRGATRMVDVSEKKVTNREATAEAYIVMEPSTLALIQANGLPKGDVLAVARVAGIMAAKRTSDLIPMCHPLQITGVTVDLAPAWDDHLRVTATVKVKGKTGVEMEALTAVSTAALTVYDMCKAVDRGMRIEGIRLLEKMGGRSGHWVAETS